MTNILSIVDEYRKVPIEGRARDLIRKITLYHRVQGSSGIREATIDVLNLLREHGLETKLYEIPSSAIKGFIETPISWDLKYAYIEIKSNNEFNVRLTFEDRPTLVSAHSPPGEGCSEIKICKDVSSCEGDAILIESSAYIAYKELDSRLIILYDSKRYPEAVPYTGLFINETEIKETSVINIPYVTAQKIMSLNQRGAKVEVCWKIETEFSSKPMYGLLAYRGDDPGILFISHICHPKPGAHDNASGVVSNILTAYLIEKTDRKYPHAHLFIPEFTGTVFMESHLPWIPRGVINLDMVGSRQHMTNSTLNIINTPLFMKSYSPSITFIVVKSVLDEASSFGGFKLPGQRYSITPYTAGSDHDVTIIRGLDSVMLNEWPSKYYHTDLDDVETISPRQLANVAVIASTSGYLLNDDQIRNKSYELFKDYLKSWYSIEAFRYNMDISFLSRIIDNQVELEYNPVRTPISMRYIYKHIGFEKYKKLSNTKGGYSYLAVYAPLAYLSNIREFDKIFQLENLLKWSSEEKKLIDETWEIIRSRLGE
ncbi:MAG: DUF4910 domain-containing protein [Desulfurococcaceae archaeon]